MPRRAPRREVDGRLVGNCLDYARELTGVGVFDVRRVTDGQSARAWLDYALGARVPRTVPFSLRTAWPCGRTHWRCVAPSLPAPTDRAPRGRSAKSLPTVSDLHHLV